MWSIMEYFSVASLRQQVGNATGIGTTASSSSSSSSGGGGGGGSGGGILTAETVKARLVHWLLTHSVAPGSASAPFEVTNLTKALADGGVLLAVLHHFSPSTCAAAPGRLAEGDDLAVALDSFKAAFGVEPLLDPACKLEERFTVRASTSGLSPQRAPVHLMDVGVI
jgi:hypothetical protein